MNATDVPVLFDGEVVPPGQALVPAQDRTLLYGLGAFETVRLYGGRPFLVERHLERLVRSLGSVGLPVPERVAALPDDLGRLTAAAGMPEAMCRITVTAGPEPARPDGGLMGGAEPDTMHVIAHLREVPPPPARPVRVGVAPLVRDARSPVVGVKSTSYLVHYLLRNRARSQGREEDLLMDGEGHVTEGTVSSLFVVRDGALVTPPLSDGVLEGVTRGLVLELARAEGLTCHEAPLAREDLGAVQEAFLTGAGKGLVGVDELDGHALGEARPVSATLTGALRATIAERCGVDPGSVRF